MSIPQNANIVFRNSDDDGSEIFLEVEPWRFDLAVRICGWESSQLCIALGVDPACNDRLAGALPFVKSAWDLTDHDAPTEIAVTKKWRFDDEGVICEASMIDIEEAKMQLILEGNNPSSSTEFRKLMLERLPTEPIPKSPSPLPASPAPPTYDQDDIDALFEACRILNEERENEGSGLTVEHGLIRVELQFNAAANKWGKRPVSHWNKTVVSDLAMRRGWSKWSCLPPLSLPRLKQHIEGGGFAGWVPAIFGMMVFDIDIKDDYAIDRLVAKYGDPLAVFPSGSGGWHAIYRSHIENSRKIKAGGYLVDGVQFGETSGGARWVAMWSPKAILSAVKIVTSYDSDGITEEMIERPAPVAPSQPDSPPVELADGEGVTARDIIEFHGLTPEPGTGRYIGPCPICAKQTGDGGSTRFVITSSNIDSRDIAAICWSSDSHGGRRFTTEEWNVVVAPILKAKEESDLQSNPPLERMATAIRSARHQGNPEHRAKYQCDGIAFDIDGVTIGSGFLQPKQLAKLSPQSPRADALRHALQCLVMKSGKPLNSKIMTSYYRACEFNGLVDLAGAVAVKNQMTVNVNWAVQQSKNKRSGK